MKNVVGVAIGLMLVACGGVSKQCASGQLMCSAKCVSATNIHTCGSCTDDCTLLPHVATAGLTCVANECSFTCEPGYGHCSNNPSDGCETDLSTSNQCGTCTNACTGGMTCQSSACACVTPQTSCGGTCYSTQSDPNHCGVNCASCVAPNPVCLAGSCVACAPASVQCSGNVVQQCDGSGVWQTQTTCPTGTTCTGGSCVCGPAPYMMCGTCVDTNSEASNCGNCGNDCTMMGDICHNGTCTCPPVICGSHNCGCGGTCCGALCC